MPIAFFYTGAQSNGGPQSDPKLSLGGYASGSPIPNGRMDNIFADVSVLTVKLGNLVETKAIIIKNTETGNITPTLGIEIEDATPDYTITIAIVTLDDSGAMEQILSPYDLPMNAEFESANIIGNVNDSVELPTMEPDSLLGIWIQRTINTPDADAYDYCALADDYTADPSRNFNIVLNY